MVKSRAGSAFGSALFDDPIGWLGLCLTFALCLANSTAWAGNGVGQVVVQTGAAAARSAAGQDRALQNGAILQAGERLVVAPDGQAEIAFYDGVRFVVGPGASLGIRTYPLDGSASQARIFDLFNGAVKASVPDGLGATLSFQTNTAVIDGTDSTWTLFAEEEVTVVLVHSGRVRAQRLDVGRGTQEPPLQVGSNLAAVIPAAGSISKPWVLSEVEREQVMGRLTPY